MTAITDRQETILALIVREYTETTQAVGSKRLSDRYNLGVSSATIRNEMAALTDLGYLRQPHTSAGRIPTEAGYRYFVRRLLGETELPMGEKRMISHQFHQAPIDMNEWLRLSASILAQHSHAASLVTTPSPERALFKHLELISIKDRQVLLVLVLQGGDVRQQMLTLSEARDQTQLAVTAAEITALCTGMDAQKIQLQLEHMSELLRDISRLVAEMMARADEVWGGEIYRDGLTNVLSQPEFAGSEAARPALRLLEERGFLDEVLAHILSPNINGVQVMIGGEGGWDELRDCSMVMTRYGAPGFAIGALGVLGPTRMTYGRTISTVRYVAGLLSEMVIESFAE